MVSELTGEEDMLEGLLWIAHQYNLGYCVTFARGLDEADMLRCFGADPSRAYPIAFAARDPDQSSLREIDEYAQLSFEDLLKRPILQVGRCRDWAFASECCFTAEGLRVEVLHAVSSGTEAVVVSYNAKAMTTFGYANDGIVQTCSDLAWPPLETRDALGSLGAMLQEAGIHPHIEENLDCEATMFALASAIGVCLDREAVVERPLLTATMIPLPHHVAYRTWTFS